MDHADFRYRTNKAHKDGSSAACLSTTAQIETRLGANQTCTENKRYRGLRPAGRQRPITTQYRERTVRSCCRTIDLKVLHEGKLQDDWLGPGNLEACRKKKN